MGQVCFKQARVIPNIDSSSQSRVIKTYPDPQCISIKKTNGTLNCLFSGSFGCFVCDVSKIKTLLLHPNTRIQSNSGETLLNKSIYSFIQSPGICVKIFFENPENPDNKHFTSEVASYTILKTILHEYFHLFTTYAEYKDPNGTSYTAFTVSFDDAFHVEIEGKPTKILRCILFKKCNEDLITRIQNKSNINPSQLFTDIGSMLHFLHKSGYAHCDIKPDNIVYCENDPIQYKLIDFNLKQYLDIEKPISYTDEYLLPRLFYEIVKKDMKGEIEHIPETQLIDVIYPILEKIYNNKYLFLFNKSIENWNAINDTRMLYYKSDEYAFAKTLLIINNLNEENNYNKYIQKNNWFQTFIDLLIDPTPNFMNIGIDDIDRYVKTLISRRNYRAASVSRGGATSRKNKTKPEKKPLKDTSKKSSH